MSIEKLFILCDDPSHPYRRVAVPDYVHIGQGRSTERYTRTAAQGHRESGIMRRTS
ncbi:hypothetical protein [Blastococcus mobilis]|uniref:Uncharacterized protein n=1 Tax=Blastococcus mobilis TaxID=1938746 RepID=A0A238W9W0_9ACTN|nr:hypothetical protein [Blastococcus mobilis]SNR43074.1 hypothetical protein SAMN06272737_1073 [Blastococcus mobilis]